MTTNSGTLDALPRSRRWLGTGIAASWVALAGVAAGLAQPLGPVTAVGALALLIAALAVGLVGGALAGSRWVLLLAPPAYVAAFEVARFGEGLTSTEAPQFGTAFGLIAFALGRLVPWLLACGPLLVGLGWGLRRGAPTGRPVGLLAATGVTAVLAVSLLLPPALPAVTTGEGEPLVGAVSELVSVELGGHEQWIEVRGASADLPVLLYLSGGPGQSDLPFSRALFEPLTRDFLVVGWDQRGTGKSYPSLDAASMTLGQAVADTIELASLLAQRYGQEKVYLLGESWGSLLGVLAVLEAPELFHAYLASGQMVAPLATDEAIYRDLVTAAMGSGDGELVAMLTHMGAPPYASALEYGTIMGLYPMLEGSYTPPSEYQERGEAAAVGPWGVLGQEYGPIEKLNVIRGLMDMFGVMYPQLQGVDLRRDAVAIEVPVHVLAGAHELAARTEPAREWFSLLEAPEKRWYTLPDSGHSVAFEQADELHRILLEEVLEAD